MTLEQWNKLSVNMKGALWPRCKSCGHISQEHNEDNSCGYVGIGQCTCCYQWSKDVKCSCKGYDGPKSLSELLESLEIPEEVLEKWTR